MKVMNHRFKRFTQKVAIGLLRMVDPSKSARKTSTLLMSPISGKRYIRSKDNQIHVIIDGHLVTIVNHSYSYVIPMEGKSHERLIRMFDMEVEARRNVMETEIRANIKHSLSNIYQNLLNEQV